MPGLIVTLSRTTLQVERFIARDDYVTERRQGAELSALYTPLSWLTFDAT